MNFKIGGRKYHPSDDDADICSAEDGGLAEDEGLTEEQTTTRPLGGIIDFCASP